MERTFQTAMTLFNPDVVFVLGKRQIRGNGLEEPHIHGCMCDTGLKMCPLTRSMLDL